MPDHPERDEGWVLQSFQAGEPRFYLEHIRRGVELLAAQPLALLIFSGGYTRAEAGTRWSEAATYAAIARHFRWWRRGAGDAIAALEARVALEDDSRDSFENLLFSVARFQQITGCYPRHVTMVSWAFKQERFDRHRAAIRFPAAQFHFEGVNQPDDLQTALAGERATLELFRQHPYGNAGPLAAKRAARNPLGRVHNFAECPGLRAFFEFMERAEVNAAFSGRLPWE